MFRDIADRGLVRALSLLGVIAAVVLVGSLPTAASASEYPPSVATNTDLRLEKSTVQPGESNTAYVRVTSGAGTPQGTVTFKVAGRPGQTVPLVNGEAVWELPTDLAPGRTYKVTARYNGAGQYRTSLDTAYVTVADGDVAGAEGDDDGAAARPATVAGDAAGLPNVGADASTTAAAVAGVALVAGGAFSLAMYRRRSYL
ncbi:MAG TPA: Ig-like domain-containing protein [Nocardioidaceae bacterium]